MSETVLHFDESVPVAEVGATLELARLAVESLHGRERLEMDVRASVDAASRTVTVGGDGEVYRAFRAMLYGLLRREFGADAARLIPSAPPPVGRPVGGTA